MALQSGFQEITSGERASEEFDFRGGRIGFAVVDVPNATPDWDLQVRLPSGDWVRVHNASHQVDSVKPYESLYVPLGTYRVNCDTATEAHHTPVKIYWAYVPASMRDAALH